MSGWHDFQGVNAGYVAELYDRYRRDPVSVEPSVRAEFDRLAPRSDAGRRGASRTGEYSAADVRAVVGVVNLAECIR